MVTSLRIQVHVLNMLLGTLALGSQESSRIRD